MIAKQLISDTIVPLRKSDTGICALNMMDEFKVRHLPVIVENDYWGLVSEDGVLEFDNPEKPLEEISTNYFNKLFATEDQHLYEVIKLLYQQNLTLLPVLDKNKIYKGSIVLSELLGYVAEMTSVQQPGAVIVLDVNEKDYLLSEIVQIVESNDAKILSLYTSSPVDSTKLEITLKLNKMDVSAVMSTFDRYDYAIKASFSEDEYWDNLMDHYNSLMNYLNI
ncbi:MAG: CBS domain-containing protein, partial [Bacteroidales bacterium]